MCLFVFLPRCSAKYFSDLARSLRPLFPHRHLLLTARSVLASSNPFAEQVKASSPCLSPLDTLVAYLIYERRRCRVCCDGCSCTAIPSGACGASNTDTVTPPSCYHPYLDVLPTSYGTPLSMGRTCWKLMMPHTATAAVQLRERALASFARITAFFEAHPAVMKWTCGHADPHSAEFSPSAAMEDHIWSWCAINSRTVYVDESTSRTSTGGLRIPAAASNGEHYALAPFLDMLNHSVSADVDGRYDATLDAYVLTTNSAIASQSEAFIMYGGHDSTALLCEYGFVVPNNPNDAALLDGAIAGVVSCLTSLSSGVRRPPTAAHSSPRLQELADMWLYDTLQSSMPTRGRIARTPLQLSSLFDAKVLAHKDRLLSAHSLSDSLACGWDGPSYRTLVAARILAMSKAELSEWAAVMSGAEISHDNECLAGWIVGVACKRELARCGVRISQAESLVLDAVGAGASGWGHQEWTAFVRSRALPLERTDLFTRENDSLYLSTSTAGSGSDEHTAAFTAWLQCVGEAERRVHLPGKQCASCRCVEDTWVAHVALLLTTLAWSAVTSVTVITETVKRR
eukprot:Opistho-2@95959